MYILIYLLLEDRPSGISGQLYNYVHKVIHKLYSIKEKKKDKNKNNDQSVCHNSLLLISYSTHNKSRKLWIGLYQNKKKVTWKSPSCG